MEPRGDFFFEKSSGQNLPLGPNRKASPLGFATRREYSPRVAFPTHSKSVNTYIYMYIYICIYVYIYTYITYIYIYIYIYIHMYTYTMKNGQPVKIFTPTPHFSIRLESDILVERLVIKTKSRSWFQKQRKRK